jgi:hypothetical protein
MDQSCIGLGNHQRRKYVLREHSQVNVEVIASRCAALRRMYASMHCILAKKVCAMQMSLTSMLN